jgi:hypothetical protein
VTFLGVNKGKPSYTGQCNPIIPAINRSHRSIHLPGSELLVHLLPSSTRSISTGPIPRSLLRKSYSRTSKSLSFPNASIGNPGFCTGDRPVAPTGPPIKTFGGDNLGINYHKCFLIPRQLAGGSSFRLISSKHSNGSRILETTRTAQTTGTT